MIFPKNVMIVEDELITQRYLKDILSKNNINVMGCFNNGEDVLIAMKGHECDMILMDINIKGAMDGLRLAKRILDKYQVPIVYITAHNDHETVEEVLELSPYGFISKPFTVNELEMALQIAFNRFLHHEKENQKYSSVVQVFDIRISDTFTYVPKKSILYRNGKIVKLTRKQISFLELLCTNINNVVSNEGIKSSIWGSAQVSDTSLRTFIYTFRKAVPEFPLESHNKLGYCITSDA